MTARSTPSISALSGLLCRAPDPWHDGRFVRQTDQVIGTVRRRSHLGKEEAITLEGTIVEALSGARFRVELESGHIILAHVSGKMRRHFIRILPGDRVTVEVSPYDLSRGRITYRN